MTNNGGKRNLAKTSFLLDPNAQAYTDNEIVTKVNNATSQISRSDAIAPAALGAVDLDDISEGTTNKAFSSTEKTKLSGIESNATADQTGAEIRDAVKGLSDTEREIVLTAPAVGEYRPIEPSVYLMFKF